jgi:hypothetical protein
LSDPLKFAKKKNNKTPFQLSVENSLKMMNKIVILTLIIALVHSSNRIKKKNLKDFDFAMYPDEFDDDDHLDDTISMPTFEIVFKESKHGEQKKMKFWKNYMKEFQNGELNKIDLEKPIEVEEEEPQNVWKSYMRILPRDKTEKNLIKRPVQEWNFRKHSSENYEKNELDEIDSNNRLAEKEQLQKESLNNIFENAKLENERLENIIKLHIWVMFEKVTLQLENEFELKHLEELSIMTNCIENDQEILMTNYVEKMGGEIMNIEYLDIFQESASNVNKPLKK